MNPSLSLFTRLVLIVSLLGFAAPLFAVQPYAIDDQIVARLRSGGERLVIDGIPLANGEPVTIELQRFDVWRADAQVIELGADGKERRLPVPKTRFYQGRVAGDPQSTVFVSLQTDGTISGMVATAGKAFSIGHGLTAEREVHGPRDVEQQPASSRAPLLIREYDPLDVDYSAQQSFSCGVEKQALPALPSPEALAKSIPIKTDGNSAPSVTLAYGLNIAVETDFELYQGFGSNSTALTNYIGDLVGKSSVIYQRDLKTTLTLGTLHIWTSSSDPWTKVVPDGTFAALDELTGYWHANYAGVNRSAVVMVSGKAFSGGVAWLSPSLLCKPDISCPGCGPSGFFGAYAFCGSLNVVTTTVPDPTLTINSIPYRLPSNNNFWILLEFVHELGHVVNSQHTHCIALDAADKALYHIGPAFGNDRNYVDQCYGGEGGCYGGATSSPSELGTIMSYCHNLSPVPTRSRYVFWQPNEASELVVPPMTLALDNGTPNGAITLGTSTPVACSAGRTASVAGGAASYAWSITGGVITSATNVASISYTPTAPNVTLTVTIANTRGCSITSTRTFSSACAAISAPTGVTAAATSTTAVLISWSAVTGAASYEVARSSDGTNFTTVGTPAGNSFSDATASALTAYLYKVRAKDASDNLSSYSAADLATTVTFTDPSLTPGSISLKALHVSELRSAVNAVRVLAGILPASFTDPALNATITVKAVHVTELRSDLDAARAALGFPPLSYTDGSLTAVLIKGVHVQEIRAGVQ